VPFRLVWANGNERQGSRCDVEGFGDYYSIAPPAGAKNHLAIGALNSNNDSMTSFSSWGPTDDGRMKPDFSAPGCQSDGDFGVTSTVVGGGYASFCGTSMASPTVCGLAVLVLQEWHNQFPGLPDPRNSTLKVLFAQNAVDLGNPGPDYVYGYGSVRIQPTIDFLRALQYTERDISHGETQAFNVTVDPGASELKVTLAWDDPPGTPNVNPALINNLDVVAIDPNNQQRFAWILNPSSPSSNATTGLNTRDNLEQVFVANPTPGTWTIEVRGTNIPQGPQTYSLAGAGSLDVTLVSIALPGGVPDLIAPGQSSDIAVQIFAINDSIVPGSAQFHYRFDGGAYTDVPLTFLGGNDYLATLPGPRCDDVPEFYFSVEGVDNGLIVNPAGGAGAPYQASVGEIVILQSTDFESGDSGWTVGGPGDDATTGVWLRGDPNATDAQPGDDHTPDPGVNTFFTGQQPEGDLGGNDVDGGQTTLTTATLDLSASPEAIIGYWRWYSNNTGADPNNDIFVVDISNNDGGSWVRAETVGPAGEGTSGGWIYHEFRVADFVAPTASVKLRFIASDENAGSLIEAAIDDFSITTFQCIDVGCQADMNGDGALNVFDFLAFETFFSDEDPRADLAAPFGVFNVFDFLAFQTLFSEGC